MSQEHDPTVDEYNEYGLESRIHLAIEFLYREQAWPSAANVAAVMGHKHHKLNSKENEIRKYLLHNVYGL